MSSSKGVGSASAPGDDSDLEDLIAKDSARGRGGRSTVEIEIGDPSGYTSSSPSMNPCFCITGVCQLCCYKFPCLSKCAVALSIFGLVGFLSYTVFNPARPMGYFGADYSAITSAYDLSLSKVDHWCIQGDNDSCRCEDPLEPNSRAEFKSWNAAHKANVADVNLYRANYGSAPTTIDESIGKPRPPIDVAFLGESVVEAMDGRWLGKRVVRAINTQNGREGPEAKKRPDIGKVFERLFRKEKGGPVEGVALGIAGDNTANVLWRLQHDEMPYDFNPQVWWLVLGMNDLTRMQCSEEIVVLGILRVVEEIRLRKPDAKIVINSLLPMVNYQRPSPPKMADFADFKNEKDKMRENMEIDTAMKKFFGDKGPNRGTSRDAGRNEAMAKGRQGFKEVGYVKDKYGGRGGRKLRRSVRRKNAGLGRKLRSSRHKRKHKRRHKSSSEDDAEEGPELEEALKRREKILAARDKRVRDKVFKDDEKYRPKRPISPFLPMIRKKVLPPVWPAVHVINDKLREFCQKHESISFFDATPIFASDTGRGGHQLHNELISPRGHPSELGFAVWEGHIMGKLHKLVVEKAQKQALPQEEDPDVDILSPESEMSADEIDAEEGGSGDGTDHVSDGKANEPEKPPTQPSRDDPSDDKDEEEDDEMDGEKEVEKAPVKKGYFKKEESSKEEEEDDEGSEDGEEEDKKEVSKAPTKKGYLKKEASSKEEEESDGSEDEEEDDEEEASSSKEEDKASVAKKLSLRKKKSSDEDEASSEEEDEDEDSAEEEEE